ncbi:MAG: GNAT family N-acetyltransferase [Dehalococcoidia bacterium]
MTLHAGQVYHADDVSIGPADVATVRRASIASDVAKNIRRWLDGALERDDICYFAVLRNGEVVGQIVLHDIDRAGRTSLVGYHLFEPRLRGLGTGTAALGLLQQFVIRETDLTELIAITSRQNIASQTIARRCGFAYVGPSREDPVNGIVFRWPLPRAR